MYFIVKSLASQQILDLVNQIIENTDLGFLDLATEFEGKGFETKFNARKRELTIFGGYGTVVIGEQE